MNSLFFDFVKLKSYVMYPMEGGLVFSLMMIMSFQVDLQAQARAHRIGQKRDVLVLRFETVSYNSNCIIFLPNLFF